MPSSRMLYLAGPDVFAPDALERAEVARRLCKEYGFNALIPSDHHETDPKRICANNFEMIQRAHIVVANLDSFRGAEPDSGTCVEAGYAIALGKKLCGYVTHLQTTVERVADMEHRRIAGPDARDKQGWHIEDFGLPANLMLACSMPIIEGGLEAALKQLRSMAQNTSTGDISVMSS